MILVFPLENTEHSQKGLIQRNNEGERGDTHPVKLMGGPCSNS